MISIVVPTYNREKIIIRTLESIQKQTFKDWECLVVDDISTDDTAKVVENFAKTDKRIKSLRNIRKKGACGARNTGLFEAQGDCVIFFDCDDYMDSNLLGLLYDKMNDGIDVATCWTRIVDINTNQKVGAHHYIVDGYIHSSLLSGNVYVNTDCALIKRDKCLLIGGWDENCPSYQELDFHLRLSKIASYSTIKQELIEYYVGGKDAISKNGLRAILGRLYILKKYEKDYLKSAPFSLYKYSVDVYRRLEMVGEENNSGELQNVKAMYKTNISAYIRTIVNISYPIVKYMKKW